MRRYLLILSCSQRKRKDPGLLPFLERYDGVNFQVIRKAMREGRWNKNIDLLILSAKYGILESGEKIPYYEQRMTRTRAKTLRTAVLARLTAILERRTYDEVFINAGKDYLRALEGWEQLLPNVTSVKYATGGIGSKMQAMKKWIDSLGHQEKCTER